MVQDILFMGFQGPEYFAQVVIFRIFHSGGFRSLTSGPSIFILDGSRCNILYSDGFRAQDIQLRRLGFTVSDILLPGL